MITLRLSPPCAASAPYSGIVRVLASASVPDDVGSSANSSVTRRTGIPVTCS